MGNFETLEDEVIKKERCSHCGACISVCPDYNIEWGADDRPRRDEGKGMCKNCTECYDGCHRVSGHFNSEEMDKFVFGRERNSDEAFGIYKKIISARAKDEEILKFAQDGGIATAIAFYLLEENKVDGVITTGRANANGTWKPMPVIATNKNELLSTSGSKYYIAPILMKLKNGVIDMELDRLAIIGLPCQVRSARYLQKIEADLAPAIMEIIGLFCTKNYDYDELSQIINGKHISIDQVSKMDVVDGKFKVYLDSNEHSFSLKEMKRSVPEICMECEDYSAEFADISIGSNGSSKGWSTVIIRTEKGLQLFTDLENKGYIETKPIDNLQIVVSNSTRKHQKAVNL
jgi:coenzyme F420 hydrogenase subunit beta